MLRKVYTFFLALALSTPAVAQTPLRAGVPFTPPEDGWYFTVPQERTLRLRLIDCDFYEKELGIKSLMIKELQEQVVYESKVAERYRLAYRDTEDSLMKRLQAETRTKYGYLALGVILTVAAGLAVGFSARSLN